MKKGLFFLLFMVAFVFKGFSQSTPADSTEMYAYIDSVLAEARGPIKRTDFFNLLTTFNSYMALQGVNGTGLISASDTASMLTTYINRSDTAAMLSSYTRYVEFLDSVSDLRADLGAGALQLTDTAAMLQSYINRSDTASMLQYFIERSDTVAMLAPYISRSDTLGMLSGYARQKSLSDTALALRTDLTIDSTWNSINVNRINHQYNGSTKFFWVVLSNGNLQLRDANNNKYTITYNTAGTHLYDMVNNSQWYWRTNENVVLMQMIEATQTLQIRGNFETDQINDLTGSGVAIENAEDLSGNAYLTEATGYTQSELDSALISQDTRELNQNDTLKTADFGKILYNNDATNDTLYIPQSLTPNAISQFVGIESYGLGSVVIIKITGVTITDIDNEIVDTAIIKVTAIRSLGANSYKILSKTTGEFGWAHYIDTAYATAADSFYVAQGSTLTLPIKADMTAALVTNYLPNGVDSLFSQHDSTILGITTGASYTVRVTFKAKNSNNTGYATIALDIGTGGTPNIVTGETLVFPKGAGVETQESKTILLYSLDTFMANGCKIKITADTGNLEIYDIRLLIRLDSTP